ncbi:MAG: LysR family transcriptional regulator [bacterium]|nr:LysR family transcriptional regulator [Acidimicrobiia bacterium]MCY4649990.1 LysR family transcriptional regulator [bacterium]
MELSQLQSFIEAANSGSFRGAARAMYLSQPSLSGRIRALERELRTPLFHRLGRGVRLTEAGEAFRPFVEQALETLDNGKEAVRNTQESQRRTITIGSARIIGTYILPPTLERFQRRYPGVAARIRTGRSSDVIGMVANGVVDIGLSRGLDHPEVFSIHLYDEPIVLATYPDHPFAERGYAYIWEVARQPLILYDPSSTYFLLINQACREAGIVPQIETMLDNIEATKRMVALGLGISFLPHSAILSEIEQGTLRYIELQGDQHVHLPTHVLVRRAQHYSAPLLDFLRLLREIYGCDISEIVENP